MLQVDWLDRCTTAAAAFGAEVDPAKVRADFDDTLNAEPDIRPEASGVREMKTLLGMR